MLKYPQIDPVALSLGPVKIHWYGLTYLVGFAGAWYLGTRRAARATSPIRPEQMGDLIFYSALGVVLGGRFGYVFFYNFDRFLADPAWALKVWEGGMSFHGGLLGVILAMLWYARKLNTTFFQLTDFVAPLVPIGLGMGRIGNFIGGELWGRATDVPWAMVFPRADDLARHPSQLYQFALEGVALFCILWWYSAKDRPKMAVSGMFLLWYGIFRFVVEFVREPDAHLSFIAFEWLTMGQLLSLPMIFAGIGFILYAHRKEHK
ncbi:MAG: prolipoprotein diacylglyceryl transferase [Proteobacteria bacterium]|nr:MAG: prolipoprotein diacylglyceryl transferase [Pseudomonadota bacterium]